MRLVKINRKTVLKVITLAGCILLSIVLPLTIYFEVSSINLDDSYDITSYLNRLQRNTTYLVIIGVIITSLTIISFSLTKTSIHRLILLVLIEVFYFVYIIIASRAEIIEIAFENINLRIDLSVLNIFFMVIPILMIIRIILKNNYERKELTCKLLILETIYYRKINSKIKIKQFILKKKEMNQELRKYIHSHFNDIIKSLEFQSNPLITRNNVYRVTKKGQDLLRQYNRIDTYQKQDLMSLEFWTEEDLENYARKRVKKKF